VTDKRLLKYKMRNRRKKKKSGFDSLGRIILGISLVLVVLLFGASFLGVFDGDDVAENNVPTQRRVTDADWEPEQKPEGSATIVNKVTTWVNDNFATETGLKVDGAASDSPAAKTGRNQADNFANNGANNRTELPPQVKVFVANGCGVNRFASRFKDELRDVGFDVWGVTDADRSDYSMTLVIDRGGHAERAEEVCSYFQARWGVGRVLLQERSGSETDVLVILGRDLSRAAAAETVGQ
jgi:LytR cell envelope-related transcriptional attenuator